MHTIIKYAAVILQAQLLLVVRKKGKDMFISPGGKPEHNESKVTCLQRELEEELSIQLTDAQPLGQFEHISAFEDSKVNITVDYTQYSGTPKASSEIEEIAWIDLSYPELGIALGSVFADEVVPHLQAHGLIRTDTPKVDPSLPTLFAFDIDGTIAFDGQIPAIVSSAIQAVIKAGTPVVIATSRAPRGVRRALGSLADHTTWICCNGALIRSEQGTDILRSLDDGLVVQLTNILDREQIEYFLEYGEYFAYAGSLARYPEMQAYTDKVALDKQRADWQHGVLKLSCRADSIRHRTAELARLSDQLAFNFHGDDTLEITPISTNKHRALQALQGTKRNNVIAFGNDGNDFDMLANAQYGVIVGDGLEGLDACQNVHRVRAEGPAIAEAIRQCLPEKTQ